MTDHLKLRALIRRHEDLGGGASKTERHFLDFVVNDRSLWNTVGKQHDMVSVFCREFAPDETIKAVNRLLRTELAEIPGDRRPLFVCAECGEPGCGALTVLVARQDRVVIWTEFG